MKALALVLTLLIFLTGFDLCKDEHINGEARTENITQTDHSDKDASDNCNPFCHCSRCPFSVLLPGKHLIKPTYLALRVNHQTLVEGKPTPACPSIWQPPKLS